MPERWCHDCSWFRFGRVYSDSVCTHPDLVLACGGTDDKSIGAMQQLDDGPTICREHSERTKWTGRKPRNAPFGRALEPRDSYWSEP